MKKALPLIVILLLIIPALLLLTKGKKTTPPSFVEPQLIENEQIQDKPFISLVPGPDGHRVTLKVDRIKNTDTLEYEILYEHTIPDLGDRIGGGIVGDNIKIEGSTFTAKDKLFGSASAGKEKYDIDVQGTSLLVRLIGQKGKRRYETEWRMAVGKKKLSLGENDFSLESGTIIKTPFIIMSTLGLPKEISGEIVGGPYGIFTSGSTITKGKVKIPIKAGVTEVKVFGWDDVLKNWKEYSSSFSLANNVVSVEVDKATTFVAIKK